MSNGMVNNWDDMEAIWDHAFRSLIGLSADDDFLSNLSIVQTEPAFNPTRNRERLLEVMFETFKAKSVNVSVQAALSLCARGNRSGVVVDAGDGVTHIVPVCEGYVQTDAVRRMDVAGRQVTWRLFELMSRQCPNLDPERDFSLVQKIKEAFCFVAPSAPRLLDYRRLSADSHALTRHFKLPDGSELSLGAERVLAPEVLFNPSLLGNSATFELRGISDLLLDAIASSPVDLRRPLFRSVLLAGGATLTSGLGRRLRGDLARNPHGLAVEVDESPQREFLAFRGAAALAEIYGQVSDWWVTRADYAELGPSAVHRLIQTSN
jgi:actin-related protein